jgi:multimeric flavodoxin WrbA
MKVIILNGSPKANGNTATALQQFGSPKIQEKLTETHFIR